jgi:alkanesulfonate monooxygenase SsuD/methylene tetrahydromethanopterin reductase-like flavin-dependent oxidoreductase (luciferase family)
MFTEALEVTTQLLRSDTPVSYTGKHFSLDEAILLPRPKRPNGPPILIGGKGPNRTMPLVAQYADEWNGVFIPMDEYKERAAQLDDLLPQFGRKPSDVKRSLMTQIVFGKDETELQNKLAKRGGKPAEELIKSGLIVGTPTAVTDQINGWVEAGIERFMLQWIDQDDIDGLENIAKDVLPHFHKG